MLTAARKASIVFVASLVMAVSMTSTASGATFDTLTKSKNCETLKSRILIRATFNNVAASYGEGEYMVKKEIRWDYLKAPGEWRRADSIKTETQWLQISNAAYDFTSSIGDVTNWGLLYRSGWRAHVTIKLVKNRPGPRDKKVEEIDIAPTKGSFRETGNCGFLPSRQLP